MAKVDSVAPAPLWWPQSTGHTTLKIQPPQRAWPGPGRRPGVQGLGGTLVGQSCIPGHPPIFPKHRHAATPNNRVSALRPPTEDGATRGNGLQM